MKRKTLKTMLGCLTLALTCSIAVGVGAAVSAYAAEVDANTLDTAFSSLTLVDGASVRYNTDGKGNGISYALSMPKTEYDAVMGENSAYNNVKFGILVAPNDYYVVHPFNNQANIDKYYSLNAEATGKAFLYDLNSSQMTEWNNDAYDANNVYFRGSIVNIKDENITLDFRGVGYVEYTKGETTEKHFFTNDEIHVRSMAYVAEQAVKAGKDTDGTLQKTYLDKVADPFATAIDGGTANVYNNATAKLDLTVKELSKVQNNTYFKDKYTYAWTLTGADEVENTVQNGASLADYVGTYTLACKATKTGESEGKTVYTKTLNITDLGTTTVNGEELTGVKGMLVKTADGTYKNEYDKNEDVVMYYTDKVQNGNFKLNAEITTISGADNSVGGGGDRGAEVGIVLASGNGLEISVFSKRAYLWEQKQLCLRVGTTGTTQIAVSGFDISNVSAGSSFAAEGAKLIFSIERKDNTFIFYNRDEAVFKVNSDGTIETIKEGVKIQECYGLSGTAPAASDANKSAVQERFAAMLEKSEMAFGIYRKAHNLGSYNWKVSVGEVPELGNPTVNGEVLTGVKGALIKTESGTYKNDNDVNEDIVQYYTQKTQNGNFKLNVEITTISGADNSVTGNADRGAEVGIVLACGNGLEISVFSKKAYLDSKQLYLRVGTNGQTQIAVSGFSVSNVSAESTFATTGAKLIFSVERDGNTFIFYNQAGTEIFKVNSDGTITATGGTVSGTDANKSAVQARLAAMLAKDETALGIYRKAHNLGAYDWNVSLAQ